MNAPTLPPSKEPFSWPTSKGDPIGPVWSYGGKKGMYQAEALRAFAHDLVDRIKEFEMPVREAMKAARGDGLDAFAYCRLLQRKNDNLLRALNDKQAKIDALMLEFCPGEMSGEQRAEWAKHQQPAHEPPAGHGFNGWFLSLEEGRQAVLREDKWMLAENAFEAGKRAAQPPAPEREFARGFEEAFSVVRKQLYKRIGAFETTQILQSARDEHHTPTKGPEHG